MNVKFVIRGLLLALPVVIIVLVAWLWLQTPLGSWLFSHWAAPVTPPQTPPPPPTILAPRGDMPVGPVGLGEWAQYQGEGYGLAACGFLLSLAGGEIVGVTTAHSLSIGDPGHLLERVAFGVAGHSGFVAESDTLWGQPGQPRTGEDLTVDYVLLQVDVAVEPGLVLTPDPRGAPQPGERVSLFSGLGDSQDGRHIWEGTVQLASDTAVWVLMDDWFDPSLMSGSPFLSQHTGQVVGMAIATSPQYPRLLLGMHPVGSLLQLARSATEFPLISRIGE
jgi:hypothetical protein